MKLAEQIYHMRTKHNLSQSELADTLGVSRQSVSKWETGASVPDLDKIMSMSEIFGVSLDELVTGNEREKIEESAKIKEETAHTTEKTAWPMRKVAGLILLCAAGTVLLMCSVFLKHQGVVTGFVFFVPLFLCGTICFLVQHPELWCGWMLAALVGAVGPYLLLQQYVWGLLVLIVAVQAAATVWYCSKKKKLRQKEQEET